MDVSWDVGAAGGLAHVREARERLKQHKESSYRDEKLPDGNNALLTSYSTPADVTRMCTATDIALTCNVSAPIVSCALYYIY